MAGSAANDPRCACTWPYRPIVANSPAIAALRPELATSRPIDCCDDRICAAWAANAALCRPRPEAMMASHITRCGRNVAKAASSDEAIPAAFTVSYTHLRAHETDSYLVC